MQEAHECSDVPNDVRGILGVGDHLVGVRLRTQRPADVVLRVEEVDQKVQRVLLPDAGFRDAAAEETVGVRHAWDLPYLCRWCKEGFSFRLGHALHEAPNVLDLIDALAGARSQRDVRLMVRWSGCRRDVDLQMGVLLVRGS